MRPPLPVGVTASMILEEYRVKQMAEIILDIISIFVDIVLSGDNALVIGMAAAGLAQKIVSAPFSMVWRRLQACGSYSLFCNLSIANPRYSLGGFCFAGLGLLAFL